MVPAPFSKEDAMSGGFSLSPGLCNAQSEGLSFGQYSQSGTLLGLSGTANVKSSWTQIGSALQFDASMIEVFMSYVNQGDTDYQYSVDIAAGPSGSQMTLLSNIPMSGNSPSNYGTSYFFAFLPIILSTGTVIWGRCVGNATPANSTINLGVNTFDTNFVSKESYLGFDTYGNTGTGTGTVVTPGNGVKGSWTQIGGLTYKEYQGLLFQFDYADSTVSHGYVLDLAVGPSASQIIVLRNIPWLISGPAIRVPQSSWFYEMTIPAGTNFWIRASDVSGSAANFGITIFGAY